MSFVQRALMGNIQSGSKKNGGWNTEYRIQNTDDYHKKVAPLAGRSYKFPMNSCSCRVTGVLPPCPCSNHSYA